MFQFFPTYFLFFLPVYEIHENLWENSTFKCKLEHLKTNDKKPSKTCTAKTLQAHTLKTLQNILFLISKHSLNVFLRSINYFLVSIKTCICALNLCGITVIFQQLKSRLFRHFKLSLHAHRYLFFICTSKVATNSIFMLHCSQPTRTKSYLIFIHRNCALVAKWGDEDYPSPGILPLHTVSKNSFSVNQHAIFIPFCSS